MSKLVRNRGLWLGLLLVGLLLAGPAHAGLHPSDGDCPCCHVDIQELPGFDFVAAPRFAAALTVHRYESAPVAPPLTGGTTRGPPSSRR